MRDITLSLLVVAGLLIVRGQTATSTASWQFPNIDGLEVNYIDTVYLQWTSNFASANLQMWCQNGTTGNNVVLGSSFPVVTSGRFGYVLTNEDPAQQAFPVACHAEIVPGDGSAGGVDSPFGITFTSQLKVAAQTFGASSTGKTTTPTSASTTSASTTSTLSTSKSTLESSSKTTSPLTVSSGNLLSPSSTSSSTTRSTALSDSSTASSSPSTSSTVDANASSGGLRGNNLGAVVGGVIGGVALLCFIVFGALFLRRYRRHVTDVPVPTSSRMSRSWWYHNDYRTTEMQTAGLHEIEGDHATRHEKAGTQPPDRHEKEGDLAKRHEIDGRAKFKQSMLFELPT